MIAITSLPLSIVADIARYLYQDWEFAKWIAILVAVDTVDAQGCLERIVLLEIRQENCHLHRAAHPLQRSL